MTNRATASAAPLALVSFALASLASLAWAGCAAGPVDARDLVAEGPDSSEYVASDVTSMSGTVSGGEAPRSLGLARGKLSAADAGPTPPEAADAGPTPPEDEAPAVIPPAALSPEQQVVAKLGRPGQFMIGLGNDAADPADVEKVHAYELPTPVDIHYMYLTGFAWPDWNAGGGYVTAHANAARARGIVPMFTLYQAAQAGDGNIRALNGASFMTTYWSGVRLMLERLGDFDAPAIVHLEPDLWGYAQKTGGDDPAAVPMRVASHVPECSDLPNDVSGLSRCMIRLARRLAPKVVVGLSASTFGAADSASVADYLVKLGARDADIVVVETLDRDAGCFEAKVDPKCQRAGKFYWDETNTSHPSFHDHLAWAKTIRVVTGRPLLWWQMPLGRPSAQPGGTAGSYRDNRVKYLFSHPDEFAAAGGIGAVFGTGSANQTTVKTDRGQFAAALTRYAAAPALLE